MLAAKRRISGTETMNERSIFIGALEKDDPAERAAYLDESCKADAAMRQRIDRLLLAHERAGGILDRPPEPQPGTVAYRPIAEGPGSVIGPYKLLQQIGEGGFGVVYMAEQSKPVQRRVALKIIKPGMDSAQVIARFEAERQALAIMDHQNIARVFDAGATESTRGADATPLASGRPYFVMELVHGVPITQYCDDNHLTPRERLELFVPVCQAIQHAHQKGIIHRDIKPSNVLVCLYDGRPVPKVIDFGVAKAIEQRLTERTMFTQFGQLVGTFEYMSPEQAEISQLGVDTRSDIYSLGVLLYELLTGTTPLERKRLREAVLTEMLRMIKEEEPPRPSTRLNTTEQIAKIAAARKTEPAKLTRLVQGELDWIAMKCLEKDRTRRYETASGLARDIERYLKDEPVEACPPSTSYRLRKFASKNRKLLITAAAFALVIFAGVADSIYLMIMARRAEMLAQAEAQRAVQAEQEARAERDRAVAAAMAENKAKETAQSREAETKAVLDFVQNKVFAAARPQGQEGGLGQNVMLRKAIEAALPFVDKSFKDQPLIEARLRMTLGTSFLYLGEVQIAADQYQAARTLYTKHLGPDHADTLTSMHNLANSYAVLSRHADALTLNEETLALRKAKLGPDHPDTIASMMGLAYSYYQLRRYADALKLCEKTLGLCKTKLGPDHPDTLKSMMRLAASYSVVGRHADAFKLNEETLTLQKAKLGPDHPATLASMNNLANSYAHFGRHADALKLREETLALQKTRLGPEHPDTLMSMMNLAMSYADLGRHADAVKLDEETLARKKAKLGPDHPDTLESMNNLAWSLATAPDGKLRDPARALRLAKEVAQHTPKKGSYWNTLGVAYYRAGDWKNAIMVLEKSEELLAGRYVAHNGFFLAMAHWQLKEKDKARAWYDKAAAWMDKQQPKDGELLRFRKEAEELMQIKKK
jgi:serine/threonine protein kinase/tetratricopeptide (TPR) repeat protein